MDSVSEGVLSHRDHHPAQEADALEPKGHRIGRRQPNPLTDMHCHRNPVESTVLRMRTMGPGNGVTRYVLSRLNGSRCQPYGVPGGIPQEAKAESNASDRLTCGRSCASDRREYRYISARPTLWREGAIPREGKASNRRSQAQLVGRATGRVLMTTGIWLRSLVRGKRARGVLKQRWTE